MQVTIKQQNICYCFYCASQTLHHFLKEANTKQLRPPGKMHSAIKRISKIDIKIVHISYMLENL